jgi:hypothetical protein
MHSGKDMTDSERLEQSACNVLRVWANDKRTPDEWIAALSELWIAVNAHRESRGWWNCQKHGKTAHQCTCGAATSYVQKHEDSK